MDVARVRRMSSGRLIVEAVVRTPQGHAVLAWVSPAPGRDAQPTPAGPVLSRVDSCTWRTGFFSWERLYKGVPACSFLLIGCAEEWPS